MKRLRVGILDLVYSDAPDGFRWLNPLRPQFAGIMPQAVAVWARQLGHRVSYAVYYGQCPPEDLLPDDLDLVFLVHFTRASALAYGLASLWRRRGAWVIAAGPHPRAFPEDCLRFFDAVVQRADRALIEDLLGGHWEPGAVLDTERPLRDLPTVEERAPEIQQAHFGRRLQPFGVVPILASTGCPYHCRFCIDAASPYRAFDTARLEAELRFIARRWPGRLVVFHDPNFGLRFEAVMGVLGRLPPGERNPYAIQASLSVLRPERLPRLQATGCVYAAPGVESWADCGTKAGTGSLSGAAKLEAVSEQLTALSRHVGGVQANFVFGTDADRGTEPAELTCTLIRRLPQVYTAVFIPTPFGGAALFDQLRAQERLLEAMPFACYYNPYLTFLPAHYSPEDYYRHFIRLLEAVTDPGVWLRRLGTANHPLVKWVHSAQVLDAHRELTQLRRIHRLLREDAAFRAFHEGRGGELPKFYRAEIDRRLGRYAGLLSAEDLRPVLPARDRLEQAA